MVSCNADQCSDLAALDRLHEVDHIRDAIHSDPAQMSGTLPELAIIPCYGIMIAYVQ